MGVVYTVPDPGPWWSWKNKQENKNLPVNEARRKYLKEQLLFEDQFTNFAGQMVAQFADAPSHAGGAHNNSITNVVLSSASITNDPNGGGKIEATVEFFQPVNADGNININVANNHAGGGTSDSIALNWDGFSGTRRMIFSVMDIPGIPFVEKNDFNAANIALGTDISGSVSGSSNLSGATGAASGSSVFTWNSGSASGSFDYGSDVSASFTVNAGGTGLSEVTINVVTSASSQYYAGNTLTATAAQLGKGGTGAVIYELQPGDIAGDVISISAGSITGGSISNARGEGEVKLDYAAQSITNTVLAASASAFE